MFIPVVIDYSLLKDVAVVALSARGECRAEVCRLVDVGKLATSWFLEVAGENTDHTVGLFSAVVREYPALFRNVRRFSTVVPALQADFALARNEKNSIIHPIEESMVVATDASLGTGHRAGIAAVSTRGRVRARSLLVESVADAEFWAVEMALATWAKKTPVLHILTDPQIVYKALRSPLGAGTPCECVPAPRCSYTGCVGTGATCSMSWRTMWLCIRVETRAGADASGTEGRAGRARAGRHRAGGGVRGVNS
mgnify:CR=1 FL=1